VQGGDVDGGTRDDAVVEAPAVRPNPPAPCVVSSPVIAIEPGTAAPVDPDPADLEALFRAHYERLVRALTVVCGDRELAADAVQEAFVKAHLRWRRLRRYDDPTGWIRRVAVNRLRDDHRRAGRRQRAVERLAAEPTGHAAAVDAAHRIDDIDDTLGALLATLPRQQRLAVALFYVDELSVAEVAATLGLADGTVKSHLHDARRRLRATLDDTTRSSP
jgi:RNA polymerase sigma-70 factor (ECF subfamily)